MSQAELGRAGVLLGLHIGEGVPTVQPVAANLKTNDLTMLTYCISLKSYLDVTHILVYMYNSSTHHCQEKRLGGEVCPVDPTFKLAPSGDSICRVHYVDFVP